MGQNRDKSFLEEKTVQASCKQQFELQGDILDCWKHLGAFVLLFSPLATITLEFIDKDKR